MNICMVIFAPFPPDIRVEKEARTLIAAGHKIVILSLGRKGIKEIEELNGITILRIYPKNLFRRIFDFLCFNLFFVNFLWRHKISETVEKYNINAIHVHDLDLIKTAIPVAKKNRIPIVADLHENLPEAKRAWRKKMNFIDAITRPITPITRFKNLEKYCVSEVDWVITVVNEAKEHYIRDCNAKEENVVVVMNTEDVRTFRTPDSYKLTDKKAHPVISYIGGFGPHRGLDTAIKSMQNILKVFPEAKLFLVGSGSKEYQKELNGLCEKLHLKESIVFTGRIDLDQVPVYIASSDVCLVPHQKNPHTDSTIPHKIFQYMVMRKPVIVTDCLPLKRIVEECNAGIVIPSGDHDKLSDAIITLLEDIDAAKRYGENGRRCVEKKYNWENDGRKLLETYEKIRNG